MSLHLFFKIFLLFTILLIILLLIILVPTGQLAPYTGAIQKKFGLWWEVKRPPLDKTSLHAKPNLDKFPTQVDDLFIVAHYDDETLADGGFLASEIKAGKSVAIVVVSLSQGRDWDQRNWYGEKRNYQWYQWKYINGVKIKPVDVTDYGLARERETEKVLDLLGLAKESRLYLHYPDLALYFLIENPDTYFQGNYLDPLSGQVEKYQGQELRETILEIIKQTKPKQIITHYVDDTNSDHRTVGRIVDDVIEKNDVKGIEVWNFLIHWNHHDAAWAPVEYLSEYQWLEAEPKDYFQVPAGSPQEIIKEQEVREIIWPEDFISWKKNLIKLYKTQVKYEPRLPDLFAKRNEIFWEKDNGRLIELRFINE